MSTSPPYYPNITEDFMLFTDGNHFNEVVKMVLPLHVSTIQSYTCCYFADQNKKCQIEFIQSLTVNFFDVFIAFIFYCKFWLSRLHLKSEAKYHAIFFNTGFNTLLIQNSLFSFLATNNGDVQHRYAILKTIPFPLSHQLKEPGQ